MSDNFAKVFESLLDSTLFYSGGKDPCWLFVVMLLKSDKDGYIRIADQGIAQKAGMTMDEFRKSIKILKSPDPESNLKKCEGKRVIALRDLPDEEENRGYLVVNKDHYRDKGSSTERTQAYRRRDEIYRLISSLTNQVDNETFRERHEQTVYVYVSVYVSDICIKYINECNVDFHVWASYEEYRKKVLKKPLKSDAGRKRQINVLKNLPISEQQAIVKETIEREWVKLLPLEKTKKGNGKDEDDLTVTGNRLGVFRNEGESLSVYHSRIRTAQTKLKEAQERYREEKEKQDFIENDKKIKKLLEDKHNESRNDP